MDKQPDSADVRDTNIGNNCLPSPQQTGENLESSAENVINVVNSTDIVYPNSFSNRDSDESFGKITSVDSVASRHVPRIDNNISQSDKICDVTKVKDMDVVDPLPQGKLKENVLRNASDVTNCVSNRVNNTCELINSPSALSLCERWTSSLCEQLPSARLNEELRELTKNRHCKPPTPVRRPRIDPGERIRRVKMITMELRHRAFLRSPAVSLVPYRINDSSSDSESDSDSSSDSDSDSSDSSSSSRSSSNSKSSSSYSSSGDERQVKCKPVPKPARAKPSQNSVKTKGELGLEDLPLIEELHITLPAHERLQIGKIHAIVDQLVIVQALRETAALDVDTILFMEDGTPLGRIFDVFGPVIHPVYSVRFNSPTAITEKGVTVGNEIFYAPNRQDLTSFIFVDELRKMKGSDASWKNNNEPPEEFLDYSDDEQEKMAKVRRRQQKKGGDRLPFNLPQGRSPKQTDRKKVKLSNPHPFGLSAPSQGSTPPSVAPNKAEQPRTPYSYAHGQSRNLMTNPFRLPPRPKAGHPALRPWFPSGGYGQRMLDVEEVCMALTGPNPYEGPRVRPSAKDGSRRFGSGKRERHQATSMSMEQPYVNIPGIAVPPFPLRLNPDRFIPPSSMMLPPPPPPPSAPFPHPGMGPPFLHSHPMTPPMPGQRMMAPPFIPKEQPPPPPPPQF